MDIFTGKCFDELSTKIEIVIWHDFYMTSYISIVIEPDRVLYNCFTCFTWFFFCKIQILFDCGGVKEMLMHLLISYLW